MKRPDASPSHVMPLATETCVVLFRTKRFAAIMEFAASLPAEVLADGRIRMMHSAAGLEVGDLGARSRSSSTSRCKIHNVREAEVSVTDLWFEYHEHQLSRELGVPINGGTDPARGKGLPAPDPVRLPHARPRKRNVAAD